MRKIYKGEDLEFIELASRRTKKYDIVLKLMKTSSNKDLYEIIQAAQNKGWKIEQIKQLPFYGDKGYIKLLPTTKLEGGKTIKIIDDCLESNKRCHRVGAICSQENKKGLEFVLYETPANDAKIKQYRIKPNVAYRFQKIKYKKIKEEDLPVEHVVK